jgi:SulP family sulfate permease
MPDSKGFRKYILARNLKRDLPASIVVFLVALPLCLGIALASGAPLFAGLITGIIGGIVTASISGSQLSVSGPAAGLTVIVLTSISVLGSYELFLAAVVIAGLLQIILGLIKAGAIANYFPSSVIEGMLAAIGVILILKQFQHAVGYDKGFEGDVSFAQPNNENTFTAVLSAFEHINVGAIIISVLSILILIFWPKIKKMSSVPAALLVVVLGITFSTIFDGTSLALQAEQKVQIPVIDDFNEFLGLLRFPDFSNLANKELWRVAVTIAIVASIETLLSLEAVDKIDPIKRVSPTSKELVAQGVGNTIAGMIGGLPMTAVIVRSSANVVAGGVTKVSAIFHGIWLLVALLFIPNIINLIPLSALAAILLMTGFKLAKPSLFIKMFKLGWSQFIPFVVTFLAVVFTDLLIGVAIGMSIGVIYILRNNMRNAYFYKLEKSSDGSKVYSLKLSEEVTFLNKGAILQALTNMPPDSRVLINAEQSQFIDHDVLEVIHNFKSNSVLKNIEVELIGFKESYKLPNKSSIEI